MDLKSWSSGVRWTHGLTATLCNAKLSVDKKSSELAVTSTAYLLGTMGIQVGDGGLYAGFVAS